MKTKYDVVFVVLVYRNTRDLIDFFTSNEVDNSHTIVVNSFFDNDTETVFKNIAIQNNADFISVPNKGYGFGNNRGVEYAIAHYSFNYLIISNADIIIKKFDKEVLQRYNNSIIAPKIVSANGKNQNPCSPYNPFRLESYLRYIVYRDRHKKLIWIFFIWSRIKKILFHLIYPMKNRIFAAHGAFVIFPYNVIKSLFPLYNEEMFLFNEEAHLGQLAQKKKMETVYVPQIIISHKEDGSMKIASIDVFEKERQSYIEYYNRWYKNG